MVNRPMVPPPMEHQELHKKVSILYSSTMIFKPFIKIRTKAFVFALLDPYSVLKNNKQNNVMTIAVLHIFCKDCKRYNALKSQEKVQSREAALVFYSKLLNIVLFSREKKIDCHFWTENILHLFSFIC